MSTVQDEVTAPIKLDELRRLLDTMTPAEWQTTTARSRTLPIRSIRRSTTQSGEFVVVQRTSQEIEVQAETVVLHSAPDTELGHSIRRTTHAADPALEPRRPPLTTIVASFAASFLLSMSTVYLLVSG